MGSAEYNYSMEKADKQQHDMVLFDSITGAIYGPNTNGVTGYVARAVAPEVSFRIGQYFKENHGEGTAPHILAHGILAAAVSVATGNDPTTGALSAMGAEAGAKHVADYLYPGIRLSDLTAEQKATVSSITSLAGLGIGASTSDVGSAVSAGETAKSAVENNNAIILHGGAFGKPEGVLGLKNTIAKLMFNNDLSKVSNPKIDYDNEYLLLVNSGPQPGVTLAENFQHLQNSPKVVAGYSVGGDAALRVGSPNGGGKWDLRVIAGARIDNVDFVNKLIQASQNSKKVIVINIVGDRNLSNDIRIANNDIYPITSSFGSQFGDRSYLALEQAINSQFGSIKNFETKYPNISIQPSFGPHGGGGNAVDTQNALIKGFTQLSNRGIK